MKTPFCLLATTTVALHAYSQSTPVQLEEVVVTATAPGGESLTVPSLYEAQAVLNTTVAGGAEVVDAEEVRKGRAFNLKDALDYAPGVYIQPRFGAEESRVSIRGSGLQRTFHGRGIMLLQDGVPINLADGGFDFQAIEPLSARYIEVYRGGNALEYGSTTLGGAINFVSFTGFDASPLTLRLTAGSFDSLHAQLASGWVAGKSDGYISLTRYSSNGYRDHSAQESWRLFSNIGYRITPNLETRFYVTAVKTDSELPGNLTKEQLEENPRQAQRNAVLKQFDNIDSDWQRNFTLWRVANKTTFVDGDHRLSLTTFWAQKKLDHPILYVIDQFSNDLGANLRYDYTGDFLNHGNRLTLGVMPTFGQTQDNRYQNLLGNRGAQLSGNRQTASNANLYFEEQFYLLPNLSFIAGSQVTYAQRKNVDTSPVTPTWIDRGSTQDWWGFSPKLGVLWEPSKGTQIYANVSRSFEPPSFGELTAPTLGGAGLTQLDAQTATTLEIGSRGRIDRLQWDVSYYHAWVDNELMEYQLLPGVNQTVNAGRTLHQGVEAALEVDLFRGLLAKGITTTDGKQSLTTPSDRLFLRQIYLWNDFRFDRDPAFGSNPLPGIPEHYFRTELMYEHPSGFYAGPNLEWVPQKYNVDSANTLFADPYALLGFKIGYRSPKHFTVFVEAKNLTNERYAATTGVVATATPNQALFLPGDGRAFYAGFEWRW